MTAATYRLLDAVADSFNPILTLIALAAPLLRKPRALRTTIAYYLAAATAIGFVYLVRAIDNHQQIWASLGLDFSTHSAFAVSLVVSIGAFNRRWVAHLVLSVVLYFSLELIMQYHGPLDVLSSVTPAALAALLLHLAAVHVSQSHLDHSRAG